MPTLIPRSCLVSNCPTPADRGGRCPEHSRQHRRVRNVDYDERLYRTARWRRLRLQVIQEEPFCSEPDCHRLTDEVHHIVKRADDLNLFFDRANLAGKCRPCHAKYTNRGE